MGLKDLALPAHTQEVFEDTHFMVATLWILVIVLYTVAFAALPPHPEAMPMVSSAAFVGGAIPLGIYIYRRFEEIRNPGRFYVLIAGGVLGVLAWVHPLFGAVGIAAMIAGLYQMEGDIRRKSAYIPMALIVAGCLLVQISAMFKLSYALPMIGTLVAFALAAVLVHMAREYQLTLTTFAATFLAMLQVPLHEALNIQANRAFGVYDSSLLYASLVGGVILYLTYLRLRRAEEEFYEKLERARELMVSGNYEAAERLLITLMGERQHNPAVKNRLATLYLRTGRYDQARELIEEILGERPDYVEGLVNMGNYHFFTGNYERSVEWYRKALEIDEKLPHVWNNLGAALANLGRIKEAREAFARALEIDPEFEKAKENVKKVAEAA